MKILSAILVLIIIVCLTVLYFYEVRFVKYPTYDILLISRKDQGIGYGIKYRKVFGIWKFGYNQQGEAVEKPILTK